MPRSQLQSEIKKRHRFDSPEEEAILNLQRTSAMLSARFDELFKQHRTSASQYNVLRILRGAKLGGDESLPSIEIAERMITRVPDVTRLVDRLEGAGLVERRRTADDRRMVLVAISRQGLDLLSRLDQPVAALNRELLSHMSRRELADLNRLAVKARCSVQPDTQEREFTSRA